MAAEPWVEPVGEFLDLSGGRQQDEADWWFFGRPLKEKLLSERALGAVLKALRERDDSAFDHQIDLGHGADKPLLRDVCFQLTQQSYELACTTYDEPQLAIFAIYVFCRLLSRFPAASSQDNNIYRINQSADETRNMREVVCCAALNLRLVVVLKPNFYSLFLEDFRTLVQRRHKRITRIYEDALERISWSADEHACFELIYLWTEHMMAERHYWKVIEVPKFFEKIWQLQLQDDELIRKKAHVKMRIARAYECIGRMQEALEMYKSCNAKDLRNVKSCISGKKLYAAIEASVPLKVGVNAETRHLEEDKIAIFVETEIERGTRLDLQFYVLDIQSRNLSLQELPVPDNENTSYWKAVKVVPDEKSQPLRVLLAPGSKEEEYTAESALSELIRGVMGPGADTGNTNSVATRLKRHFMGPGAPVFQFDSSAEPVELWEFCNSKWKRIPTYGSCVPDSWALSRPGSSCAMLGDRIVLFGGMELGGSEGRSSTSNESSAGVFVLELTTRKWFRIPHPYGKPRSAFGGWDWVQGQTIASLPSFHAVWNVELEGKPFLAMLRPGNHEVYKERNKELVPKYALDLLGIRDGGAYWIPCVPAADQCGYIASVENAACAQVGSTCLVMGHQSNTIYSVGEDGMPELPRRLEPQQVEHGLFLANVLDFSNMEWRGVNIYNIGLLQDGHDGLRRVHIIPGDRGGQEKCYVLITSLSAEVGLTIASISNLQALPDCYTKRRSRVSKKHTLSYKLRKAAEETTFLKQECAYCHALEPVRDSFKCCARCRVPYYCSTICQSHHWKASHKKVCKPKS